MALRITDVSTEELATNALTRQLSRRRLLALMAGSGAAASLALSGCSPTTTEGDSMRHTYGNDPSQYGDLYLPTGQRKPGTMIVIHGGFWRSEYGADLGAPLSADLARRGWAAWNLEYRRLGNGGGWPETFADIAAGIDHLAVLAADGDRQLDLEHVVAIGHSAGGQLAAWAAIRPLLGAEEPGTMPQVAVTAVISQAGVLDLAAAAQEQLGGGAASSFLGGSPSQVPDRYSFASPQQHLPTGIPVRCVHGRADTNVPFSQSSNYVQEAIAAGDPAELVEVPGDHFSLIDDGSAAWRTVIGLLPELVV